MGVKVGLSLRDLTLSNSAHPFLSSSSTTMPTYRDFKASVCIDGIALEEYGGQADAADDRTYVCYIPSEAGKVRCPSTFYIEAQKSLTPPAIIFVFFHPSVMQTFKITCESFLEGNPDFSVIDHIDGVKCAQHLRNVMTRSRTISGVRIDGKEVRSFLFSKIRFDGEDDLFGTHLNKNGLLIHLQRATTTG
jgi:hypothetical protein